MRILLVAYEYPPIISAQSLRWFYLANELAEAGVDIHILTTEIRDWWNFSGIIHPKITLHRCFPGPFIQCPNWIKSSRSEEQSADTGPVKSDIKIFSRAYGILRDILNVAIFPDVRSEWFVFAWKKLRSLVKTNSYDILITSHEPGVDLLIGLAARQKYHLPWVVDLGDPLLAPYTPRYRRWLDFYVEGLVVKGADHLIVTTEGVVKLLLQRHGSGCPPITVVSQGYDRNIRWFENPEVAKHQFVKTVSDPVELSVVYTGTFYRNFRNPEALLEAIHKVEGIRLIVAGEVSSFQNEMDALGPKVVLLGRQNHDICLRIQREATLLLNVGNSQSYQIPGKLFEYFGADRPILHLTSSENDPAIPILARTRRGIVVPNHCDEIVRVLGNLYQLWKTGDLDSHFDLSPDATLEYSWTSASQRILFVCSRLNRRLRIRSEKTRLQGRPAGNV